MALRLDPLSPADWLLAPAELVSADLGFRLSWLWVSG
jgi:hypothetical protein